MKGSPNGFDTAAAPEAASARDANAADASEQEGGDGLQPGLPAS